jgi:4'-phosphopantetheinyl transferase
MLAADHCIVRWLAFDAADEDAIAALAPLLDETERARAARFHFQRDRNAYLAAHALTRRTLSALFPRPAADWRFRAGPHGKPAVDHPDASRRLSFNLSHARGIVAVAVMLDHCVGVDVERVEARRLSLELADHSFAPAEAAAARAAPETERTETLFAFWTLKEAYIKAVGKGLALPLDAFAFTLEPLAISFDARLADDPARWLFRRFRPTADHALALGIEHPAPASVTIDIGEARLEELQGPVGPGSISRR